MYITLHHKTLNYFNKLIRKQLRNYLLLIYSMTIINYIKQYYQLLLLLLYNTLNLCSIVILYNICVISVLQLN